MTYTPPSYTGNGTQRDFIVTFPYLETDHVYAFVNLVETQEFDFISSNTIRFRTTPGVGIPIQIFRRTPSDDIIAVRQAGAEMSAKEQNDNWRQSLYRSEEPNYFSQTPEEVNPAPAGLEAQIIAANNNASAAVITANAALAATNKVVSVKDIVFAGGAVGNGVVNDTVSIQAAFDAGGRVIFPPGTYLTDTLDVRTNLEIEFQGGAILKRRNAATGISVLSCNAVSNFKIRNARIDGNLANNTIAADNIRVSGGCFDFVIEDCELYSAKYDSGIGRGNGIYIEASADLVNDTRSRIANSKFRDCANGIEVTDSHLLEIKGNTGKNITFNGILIRDLTLPASASPTSAYFNVTDNVFSNCGVGIGLYGSISEVTALGDVLSQSNWVNGYITVANNIVYDNTLYGMILQGTGITADSNVVRNNGSNTSNGGMLFTVQFGACSDNIVRDNYYYGIDAGLCVQCAITGNQVHNNGSGVGQGIGINVGATNGCYITGNKLGNNGGTAFGSYQILGSAVDGTGAAAGWAPFGGSGLVIKNNDIILGSSFMTGISVRNGFTSVEIVANSFNNSANGDPLELLSSPASTLVRDNAVLSAAGSYTPAVASAATTVIPDNGGDILITGNTTITTLRTKTQNTYINTVYLVVMSNIGTGYTAPPIVTFTGGGGVGAAGTPALAADGKIYGVYMTNFGSGYVTAPTVAFVGGGGSGAAAAAFISPSSPQNLHITLGFDSTPVINTGVGNIFLASAFTGGPLRSLTLRAASGNWLEVSRA